MNEQELREKIVKILEEAYEPIEYGDDDIHGAQIYFPSNEDVANALISAGIGDVSGLKNHRLIAEYSLIPEDGNSYVLPNTPLRVKQLYSGEEVERIAKERDEYKHRAEVAERALKNICKNIRIDSGDNEDEIKANSNVLYKAYLKQAENELAEERKDE